MNDKERTEKKDAYHILFAIRRKKENRELKELVFRQIVRNYEEDINILKSRIKGKPGRWRIYHTVNARLHKPARKLLMKRLIDYPEDSYRIDTLFKTCLLKNECKATRNFLVDVDTRDKMLFDTVYKDIKKTGVKIISCNDTPNGYHIVTEKFDTRILFKYENVDFQRDGYYLVEVYDEK